MPTPSLASPKSENVVVEFAFYICIVGFGGGDCEAGGGGRSTRLGNLQVAMKKTSKCFWKNF
jgi:hypothetical protein